jgi:amicyanin
LPKGPAFVATVVAVSFVALAVPAIVMMAAMMGSGHMAMMGGRGSNPAAESPVLGVTQVRIEDFAFSPANIVVDVGTTVTWTNEDSVAHTVTSNGGGELASPLLGKNKTFSRTFDKPGTYAYHCTPHSNMKGLVTVRAVGAGPSVTPSSP